MVVGFEEAGEVFGGGEADLVRDGFDGEVRAVGEEVDGAVEAFVAEEFAEFATQVGFEDSGQVGAVHSDFLGEVGDG